MELGISPNMARPVGATYAFIVFCHTYGRYRGSLCSTLRLCRISKHREHTRIPLILHSVACGQPRCGPKSVLPQAGHANNPL